MKGNILVGILLVFVSFIKAQQTENLDLNNIRAKFHSSGYLFGHSNGAPDFEAPKGSGLTPIFTAGLWIGGIDAGGQLHVAAETYRQMGTDYYSGPMDTTIGASTAAQNADPLWDRCWKVNKSTIDSFRQGLYGNVIPLSISSWPAHGAVVYNNAHYLAPFIDVNHNGQYDPTNGDYPAIEGDQAVYFIYNDRLGVLSHTESGGLAFGIEVHAMAYVYKCVSDSALENTIFINYNIINRSTSTYHNCYATKFVDFDIGTYSDDYIGCDVERQSFMGYESSGGGGYGNDLASEAVVFLRGIISDPLDGKDNNKNCQIDELGETCLMSSSIYFNNDQTYIGNPTTANDYYGYMKSTWKNGTHLTYGANGFQPQNVVCSYMFPGLSDQLYQWGTGGNCQLPAPVQAGWDELTINNLPSDVRGVGSSGPFTMRPGGVYNLHVAYVFGRDYTGSGPQASLNVLNERIDSIRSYFSIRHTPCGLPIGFENIKVCDVDNSLGIYPNPNKGSFILETVFAKSETIGLILYNVVGNKIWEATENVTMGTYKRQVDIQELPEGIYFLSMQTSNGRIVKKVVKQ